MSGSVKLSAARVFRGPSGISNEPCICVTADWVSGEIVPDGQQLLITAGSTWSSLELLPHIATESTPFETYAMAVAVLAKHLLNLRRGAVQRAGKLITHPRRAIIFVGMHDPEVSLMSLGLAVRVLAASQDEVSNEERIQVDGAIEEFLRLCRNRHPDKITKVLMAGARTRNIPVLKSNFASKLWQYGWGCRGRLFSEAASNSDGFFGHLISKDKSATLKFLEGLGFPVPDQRLVDSAESAIKYAEMMGRDVVIKPLDRGQGLGVTVGPKSNAQIESAFNLARRVSERHVIVERRVHGDDYRLLVVEGILVAASRRDPPFVTGDGAKTITELVDALNLKRRRHPVWRSQLQQIVLDGAVQEHLERESLSASFVPGLGEKVTLRGNANISTGGVPIDVLKSVHQSVREICESIAASVGVHALGIDYISPNVALPFREVGGMIIEINTFPGVDVHIAAGVDEADLGGRLLGKGPGRIPVALFVGSDSTLRKVSELLSTKLEVCSVPGIGLAFPSQTALGCINLGLERDPFERVMKLLRNRKCQAILVGCDAKVVISEGFPVDQCDLSLIFEDDADSEEDVGFLTSILGRVAKERVSVKSFDARGEELCDQIFLSLLDLVREGERGDELGESFGCAQAPAISAGVVPLLPSGTIYVKSRSISDGPTVFALMRDEIVMLPHFLAHYRQLGVENFVFHDDRSVDGSLEYVLSQPDCSVLSSEATFSMSLQDGRKFHHFLAETIPESFGSERWVLKVDLDEFLILPDLFKNISCFQKMLDERGHTCVFGSMVDAYPETLRARNYSPLVSPFEGSPYFDMDAGFLRQADSVRPQKRLNGFRSRLITALKRTDLQAYNALFAGKGYMMPALYKVPFVKTGAGVTRHNAHVVNKQPPFDIEVALAHFKFGPDLDRKIECALRERQYYLSSIEYRFLKLAIERFSDSKLVCDRSLRFDEPGSLSRAGFLRFD